MDREKYINLILSDYFLDLGNNHLSIIHSLLLNKPNIEPVSKEKVRKEIEESFLSQNDFNEQVKVSSKISEKDKVVIEYWIHYYTEMMRMIFFLRGDETIFSDSSTTKMKEKIENYIVGISNDKVNIHLSFEKFLDDEKKKYKSSIAMYDRLTTLIQEAPKTTRKYTVFRGIRKTENNESFQLTNETLGFYSELKKGETLEFNTIFSTSFDPTLSFVFMRGNDCCFFRITIPPGISSLFLGNLYFDFDQTELLMLPCRLIVTKVYRMKLTGRKHGHEIVVINLKWIEYL
jgi:hypothetical protein